MNIYWIVDPIEEKITVFNLVEGLYEETIFQGNKAITSPMLSQLNLTSQLTVKNVLQGES